MEARFESLNELFKDAEVAQQLLSYTAEEAVVVLRDQHQLDFTVEELNDVASGINAYLSGGSADELTGEQLEEVVGGAKSGAYYAGYYIGKTVSFAGTVITIVAAGVTGTW